MMAAASIYHTQRSTDEYYRAPSPTTSLSPTLINNAHYYAERPSLKLSFPCGVSNILNSAVIDAARQSVYSNSSNSKRTTVVSCRDNVEVATVQWNHHCPRMVFRGKKMKCKEWLKPAGPENESRILTYGDAQFTWMQDQGSASGSGHLIPANRPGLEIARWKIKSGTDEIILEIFREDQETQVESGLLDSIVLSVVLLRSGYPLNGSTLESGGMYCIGAGRII